MYTPCRTAYRMRYKYMRLPKVPYGRCCIPIIPGRVGHEANSRHRHHFSRCPPRLEYKPRYTGNSDRREAEFEGRLPTDVVCMESGKYMLEFDPIVRPLSGLHPALRSPPFLHTPLLLLYLLHPLHLFIFPSQLSSPSSILNGPSSIQQSALQSLLHGHC